MKTAANVLFVIAGVLAVGGFLSVYAKTQDPQFERAQLPAFTMGTLLLPMVMLVVGIVLHYRSTKPPAS